MVQFRWIPTGLLGAALVFGLVQGGKSDDPKSPSPMKVISGELKSNQTCTIYPLAELGDDPEFGAWVAETIPQVIEPASWNKALAGANLPPNTLSYYAPKKMLVVYQTPAVQQQVASFLKSLKKTCSEGRPGAKKIASIIPAGYSTSVEPKPLQPSAASTGYAVPAPVQQPKHLFHFIIRYEGDGLVDANVVKAIKAQAGGNAVTAPSAYAPSAAYSAAPVTSPLPPQSVPPGATPSLPQSVPGTVGTSPSPPQSVPRAVGTSPPSTQSVPRTVGTSPSPPQSVPRAVGASPPSTAPSAPPPTTGDE